MPVPATPSPGVVQWIRHEKTGAKLNVVTSDRRRALKRSQIGNGITDTSTAWLNWDVSCRLSLNPTARHDLKENGELEGQPGRTVRHFHRRRSADLSRPPGHRVQTARFLKSRNPHSVVKLKDLHTGDET